MNVNKVWSNKSNEWVHHILIVIHWKRYNDVFFLLWFLTRLSNSPSLLNASSCCFLISSWKSWNSRRCCSIANIISRFFRPSSSLWKFKKLRILVICTEENRPALSYGGQKKSRMPPYENFLKTFDFEKFKIWNRFLSKNITEHANLQNM